LGLVPCGDSATRNPLSLVARASTELCIVQSFTRVYIGDKSRRCDPSIVKQFDGVIRQPPIVRGGPDELFVLLTVGAAKVTTNSSPAAQTLKFDDNKSASPKL
jgi:hypothetical protein